MSSLPSLLTSKTAAARNSEPALMTWRRNTTSSPRQGATAPMDARARTHTAERATDLFTGHSHSQARGKGRWRTGATGATPMGLFAAGPFYDLLTPLVDAPRLARPGPARRRAFRGSP